MVQVFPDSQPGGEDSAQTLMVRQVTCEPEAWRKAKLLETLQPPDLPPPDLELLRGFLTNHHDVLSLTEGEHGETDLVHMDINTGNASPKKQPPQMPFAVSKEVAKRLKSMQHHGVIQPPCSPWSSPVMMVRKKGGSHRFCVN